MEAMVIALAFAAGLVVRQLGYPPLLGYLFAGFLAHGVGIGDADALTPLSQAGVLLLLFTIGLKLEFRALAPRYVWGTAVLHMLVVVPLTAFVILLIGLVYKPMSFEDPVAAWTLAFALSFSSTVFAVKMFEERGEAASQYATIAVGILVVQDVLAVLYLVFATGHYPSPYALLLLGLPLLRQPLAALLRVVGHGELLLLCGVALAFSSAAAFDAVHLETGLGALVAGMLVAATHKEKAKELYKQIFDLKNLLLISFMVQIGYNGIPSAPMVVVAIVLSLLIILRPFIYFACLTWFGLRARTAMLTGVSLFNYSEFGLIVAAVAVSEGMFSGDWVTTLALAMAMSYVLATPVNDKAHALYRLYQPVLTRFEKKQRLPEEAIGSLGDATAVVLGMGRIGRGVYASLQEEGRQQLIGIDESYSLTQDLQTQGFSCIHGDASDRDFWERTGLANRELLLLSLSSHRENLAVVNLAGELGFGGTLAVTARFPDEKKELEALGCVVFNLYQDLGRDFVQHTLQQLTAPSVTDAAMDTNRVNLP